MKSKFENLLKKFDLFGINFELRMQNYEKFRTKTGAIASITYFIFSTILALILLIQFIYNPKYITLDYEEAISTHQIKWKNENFILAVRLPTFYDDSNNIIHKHGMFYIKAMQRSRNSSRTLEKGGNETKIPISTKPCNLTDIFSTSSYVDYIDDLNIINIICFEFNETHYLKNNEFTNHSYIKIEIWVNNSYYNDYIELVKKQMKNDPFYLNLIFPVNIISDDYTKSNQFLNGIFLYLNEKEKTIADIYLKKNIYKLDNNVIFNNPIDYHYNNYYTHTSHNTVDDFFYNLNSTNDDISKLNNIQDDPKIAKIYIRNHVMSSIYVKTRQKILPFLQEVSSVYINIFLSINFLFMFINLKIAKKEILRDFFEIDFSYSDKQDLNENDKYRSIKLHINKEISKIKKNNKDTINNVIDYKVDMNNLNINSNINNNENEKIDQKCLIIKNTDFTKYKENYCNIIQSSERKNINDENTNKFIKKSEKNNIEEIKSSKKNSHDFVDKYICNEKSDDRIQVYRSSLFPIRNNKLNNIKIKGQFVNMENRVEKDNNILYGKNVLLKSNKNNLNFKNLFKNLFYCNISRIHNSFNYYNKAEKLIDPYFDIKHFIMRINEIQELKEIILNNNQKILFEYLSYPSHKIKQNLKNYDFSPMKYIENENDSILKAYECLYREKCNHSKNNRLRKLFDNQIDN